MVPEEPFDVERARSAPQEEISALLLEASEEILAALLENPHFDESHLCLLLERKDLSGGFLEAIALRKTWMATYRVKRRIAFHPHTPRLVAMRVARALYLMDLVQLSLLPAVPGELRRMAEELVVARLRQLPLGQKLTLARRASARVAGALLAEGQEQIVRIALDNAFLTEAQVLRVLSKERLPAPVVVAIARHGKWSRLYNVRRALVRHPQAPLASVLAFLPNLTQADLKELCRLTTLSENLRRYISHELTQRSGSATRASGPKSDRGSRRRSPSVNDD